MTIDTATLRRLSVEAEVDPRTLRRFLLGERIRGLPRWRIERVLRQEGLLTPSVTPAPKGEERRL